MLNTESFATVQKAQLDALRGLTAKAVEGAEQLAALNIEVVKSSFDEAAENGRAVLAAKDPQALLALQAGLLQPAVGKAAAYGRQVYDIVATTRVGLEKLAAEQVAGVQSSFFAAVDAATKNAPEGVGNGVALVKTAVAAANNAFEGLQKANRQAAEAVEANLAALAPRTAPKAAPKAAPKSRRA